MEREVHTIELMRVAQIAVRTNYYDLLRELPVASQQRQGSKAGWAGWETEMKGKDGWGRYAELGGQE
jgi:hypothetical protein